MQKKAIYSLLTLPVCIFSQDNTDQEFDRRLTALEEQVKETKLYNAPSHPHVVDGYRLFITGDALFWKATENGLTYAFKTNNASGVGTTNQLQFKEPSFNYDWGFRGGLGYNIPHGGWDLYSVWTHFFTGANSTMIANTALNEGIYPVWANPSGPMNGLFATEAQAFWKLHLNIIDVELGKEYFVGKKLSLRPHLDLRTLWIRQHFTVHYNNVIGILGPFDDLIEAKNKYWGIGPRIGLDLQWELAGGFSIYGDGAFSIVYGNFKIQNNETATNSPEQSRFGNELHISRSIADVGLFLGWDYMLFHDQFHIGVKGGWEGQLFFEQNQFFRFVDPSFNGSILSNQGDLTLQGWTFSARIDF